WVEGGRAGVPGVAWRTRPGEGPQRALASGGRDPALVAGRLAAASRSKDEFLAVLSHELRTPLTPILSWSFLLREGQLSAAEQERALRAIERNARLQGRIVEDLLDVSRAITGKLRLDLQPIALAPVIQAASDAVRATAEA